MRPPAWGHVRQRISSVANYVKHVACDSQSYRERTHDGYSCVERSKTEGVKQRAGRCHKGNATAHAPEPPHTDTSPTTRTSGLSAELPKPGQRHWGCRLDELCDS
eukprot:78739-Chlamydomonas_euryale.AAC.2